MRLRKYPVLILDSGFAAGSIEIHFLFNSFILFSLNNGAIYWGLRAVITFKRGSVHWQWAALTIVLIIPQKKKHIQPSLCDPPAVEHVVPAWWWNNCSRLFHCARTPFPASRISVLTLYRLEDSLNFLAVFVLDFCYTRMTAKRY